MNSNRSEGGGRGGHRKDVSPRKEYRKDTYRSSSKGKDDSGRKEYRKDRDTYRSKDDSGRKEYRKDRDTYRKDDSERKEYRKDRDTYRKDDSERKEYRKDTYRKDDTGRKDYRKDTYRKDTYHKDDSGRKEYRKDTYRKDDSGRKEYRKDTYRKDDSGRKEYRKDTYSKDDSERKEYRKDTSYRKDDSGRKEYRKDTSYRKDDSERKEYRKDTYRKDDSERKEYRKDTYRKDDTRRDDRRGGSDHRKDYHRKDGARGDNRSRDHHRGNKDDRVRKSDSSVSTRQLVQRILADFDSDPGDPERIADRILARRHIEDRDRRFVFELVYGVLRNRIYLDYVIDKFISDEREPMSDALRRILRIGSYQILFLDRVPDHAAVNETVNLAKRDPSTAPGAGFINAVLRKVINNKFAIELPDSQTDLSGRLSIEFSHPKWMVERWLARYGLGDTKKILAFNNERPAIYLRRKRRDISRPQFEFDMRTLCEAGGGYLNLYYKMTKPLEPENLRILQDGFCSVQSPSSGWVVAMLDLRDGDRVLDMCGAPGGKATLMAELVGDAGFVAACDNGRWKIKMLAEAINAQSLENIYPLVCDSVAPPFLGTFNKVLLDAPCSGSGVLQRHPDGRFVRTAEDIDGRVLIQRALLDSAAKLVNGDGGILVYSTCSLEPEENEHQVKWFLDEHPEFKLDHPPDVIPAMYIDDAACLRITPYKHNMDGMFGARFKKG